MKTIEEYFAPIRQLIRSVPEAHAERYEEQILSPTRGNLRIRLRFSDQALLEISEALVLLAGEPQWLSYRYHYQDSSTALVFRYDDAPHHPEILTHPDHKHSGDLVLASVHPSIEQVLEEVLGDKAGEGVGYGFGCGRGLPDEVWVDHGGGEGVWVRGGRAPRASAAVVPRRRRRAQRRFDRSVC